MSSYSPATRFRADPLTYSAFGLRIHSEIELPEMLAARSEDDGLPRIDIRIDHVPPPRRIDPEDFDPAEVDDLTLQPRNVARFRIVGGSEIIVAPHQDVSPALLRLFLLGRAFGALCHQRGLFPLHASAVEIGGRAIAFAGRSGAGKSTLAAYFESRGHHVLSDDVCVVNCQRGRPMVWAGLARIKLKDDAIRFVGLNDRDSHALGDAQAKRSVRLTRPAIGGPFPLERLYILGRAEEDTPPRITRKRGLDAVAALLSQTFRPELLMRLGGERRHMEQAITIAGSAQVFEANRLWGFDHFEREAQAILDHALTMPGCN